jgi:hypothetical protein
VSHSVNLKPRPRRGAFLCRAARHACSFGLEGIVSKRKDSAYRSGRSPDWLKMKNADAPAVKREAEEDWGRVSRKNQTFLRHKSSPGQSVAPL